MVVVWSTIVYFLSFSTILKKRVKDNLDRRSVTGSRGCKYIVGYLRSALVAAYSRCPQERRACTRRAGEHRYVACTRTRPPRDFSTAWNSSSQPLPMVYAHHTVCAYARTIDVSSTWTVYKLHFASFTAAYFTWRIDRIEGL